MQPQVLVYKRWRDDLVCRHHDEVLFWGNMFFSLVGRGVSPAPNQQSTPIFSSVPSNLQCCQANILYKESYSKWWFEGGGDEPLVPQEAYFANFLGKFFSKLPHFFLPWLQRYLSVLNWFRIFLWNEVRNWFLTCSNFAQLMLVTTATNGVVYFFKGGY